MSDIALLIRPSLAPLALAVVTAAALEAGLTPGVTVPSTAISADAENIAILGTDQGIYVGHHVHTQGSALATWTVNHNLGRRPVVAVHSVGGVEVEAAVLHLSANQLQVMFAAPYAGSVRCV